MDEVFKDFLERKNDQIVKTETIANLAFASTKAIEAEIKSGFSNLAEKFDRLHMDFVTVHAYEQDRRDFKEMLGILSASISKVDIKVDKEHAENDHMRGQLKRWGGAFAVIIFVISMILK